MDGSFGGDGDDKRPSGSTSGSGSGKNGGYSFGVNPQLMSLVERIERREADKKECADDVKMIYAEASGQGWDTEALRRLIRRRKKTMDKRRDERAMDDLFDAAVGESVAPMSPGATEKLDPDRKDEPDGAANAKDQKTDKKQSNKKPPGSGGDGADATGSNQKDMIDNLTEPAGPTYAELEFEARMQGAAAQQAGKKITECPLAYNDPHRVHWEEGWMSSAGSTDGMDVPKALRRKDEKKPAKSEDETSEGADGDAGEADKSDAPDDDNDEARP